MIFMVYLGEDKPAFKQTATKNILMLVFLVVAIVATTVLSVRTSKNKEILNNQAAETNQHVVQTMSGFGISGDALNTQSFLPTSCASSTQVLQQMKLAKTAGPPAEFIDNIPIVLSGTQAAGGQLTKTTYTTDILEDQKHLRGVFFFTNIPNGTYQLCVQSPFPKGLRSVCTSQSDPKLSGVGHTCTTVHVNNGDVGQKTTFVFNQ